jgi:hypothetical protein
VPLLSSIALKIKCMFKRRLPSGMDERELLILVELQKGISSEAKP